MMILAEPDSAEVQPLLAGLLFPTACFVLVLDFALRAGQW